MNEYQESLKSKMNSLVHSIYRVAKTFPKDEIFGTTSQPKRASLSIILNYIEGYARIKPLVRLNFLEISYGSFKESKYLLHFSLVEKFLNKEDYEKIIKLSEEVGAMLWREIENVRKNTSS